MINIPQHEEGSSSSHSNLQKNILEIMNLEEKVFSCTLDFSQGSEQEHLDIIDEVLLDGLIGFLSKENIHNRTGFYTFANEISKNSAQHGHASLDIHLSLRKDITQKKAYLSFSLLDTGPGLPFDETYFLQVFSAGTLTHWIIKDWNQECSTNRGTGLGRIKAASEVFPMDLFLHNKGKVYQLSNIGLVPPPQPKNEFGYEGLLIFDLKE